MRSADLERLSSWTSQNKDKQSADGIYESVNELRAILGDIMKAVNEASVVFKSSVKNPTPENAAKATAILGDIENFEKIKSAMLVVRGILTDSIFKHHPNVNSLVRIVDYLERSRFTPQQVEELRRATGTQGNSGSDFPDETNKEGLDAHLRNSIYNTSRPGDRTLKVIREILQNAVDATDPKTHPHLVHRMGFKPEIRVTTHDYKEYMDLTVEDKGVGMDWETLSNKFFVTFNSGKSQDTNAAGGFGIAKALIQDTPEHGWSIDTNGIHSSRFHKNMYFGSRRGGGYQSPTSSVSKEGTTLSLHGLPKAYSHQIEDLCEVYATNGRVGIYLNDKKVEPRFVLDSPDIKNISGNLDEIPEMLSGGISEKESAKRMFSEVKEKIKDKLEDIGHFTDKSTTINFFVRKTTPGKGGKFYVMVNGQYQFDEDKYINKLDVICSIQTTARPGSDEYPLDPGRGYVRGPVKDKIDQLINSIREFSSKLAEDDLFKQGIESIIVNEDSEPMSSRDSDSTTTKKEELINALNSAVGDFENAAGTQGQQGPSAVPDQPNGTIEDVVDSIARKVQEITGPSPISDSTVKGVIADILKSGGDKIEQKKKIQAAIDGLVTPGHVLIQKNFVGRDVLSDNISLTGDIMILWQRSLKLLMEKMSSITRYAMVNDKKFIPGVVFSDECLGLWMRAKPEAGRKYDSISINPMTIAAAVMPKLFRERMEKDTSSTAFAEIEQQAEEKDKDSKSSSADTPTNRVAKFIFHIAIHELCHLIYPDDMWSRSEKFHENITRLEMICHDEFEQIRQEVRYAMPRLRKSAQKLIMLMGKTRAKNEVFVPFAEWEFLREKETPRSFQRKARKEPNPNTFKEFISRTSRSTS